MRACGRLVLVLAGLGLLAAATSAAAATGPLDRFRWKTRVLVVSAPGPDDPLLRAQRDAFAAMTAGARERDLVLVEAVGAKAEAQAIRRQFDLDPGAFQAVLVGKDGGDKLRSDTVLGPDQLFPVIDAMPMRQGEMRR